MATVESTTCIAQIGETSGIVWRLLDEAGSLSLTQLVKKIEAPRDLVMQAIGWLAREEKVTIEETPRSKIISLVR